MLLRCIREYRLIILWRFCNMSKNYIKPALLVGREPVMLIPAVIGAGMALASALGLAASSAAAVGGLAVGAAAAGLAAGGVAAGTALAKKTGQNFGRLERLPTLDVVEVYS
jgi:hypothetical protein